MYGYAGVGGGTQTVRRDPLFSELTVMGLPGARARFGHLRVMAMMVYLLVLIAFALAGETATAGMLVAPPYCSQAKQLESRETCSSSEQTRNQNQTSGDAVRGGCCSCDRAAGLARSFETGTDTRGSSDYNTPRIWHPPAREVCLPEANCT